MPYREPLSKSVVGACPHFEPKAACLGDNCIHWAPFRSCGRGGRQDANCVLDIEAADLAAWEKARDDELDDRFNAKVNP